MPMSAESGTTNRRRYQVRFRNHPSVPSAMAMIASCPTSIPALNIPSASSRSSSGKPSSVRTRAKPRPWRSPKTNTTPVRQGLSRAVNVFSAAIQTIDSAINGSTNPRRERHDRERPERQGDGVGQRERRDLPDERPQSDRKQEETKDKEDVVCSVGHDVDKAEPEILPANLTSTRRGDLAPEGERVAPRPRSMTDRTLISRAVSTTVR